MEIKINKEIRDYQESIFLGLSLRQFIFALLAAGAAVGVYFGFRDLLGKETVSWVCILSALPFAVFGFVKYHGMPAEEFLLCFLMQQMTPVELPAMPFNLYAEALRDSRMKEVLRID